MRIKSVVSKAPAVMLKPFPKLMISDGGTVVHFTSEHEGVVVAEGGADHKALEFSDTWTPSGFADFDGSVTLTVGNF